MTPQHPHRRPYAPLYVVGLLLVLAVAAGLALLIRPVAAGIALDPNIPHERALIAAGLSGTPGPGQPAVPVAVDRVLVDGAATYIQYRIIQPLGTVDDLSPALTDDRGTTLNAGSSGFLSPPGLTLPFPLPAWLPCRPMVSRRAAGLTLTLQEISFTHLIYTYASPLSRAPSLFPSRLLLADSAGHAVAVATIGGKCVPGSGGPSGMSRSQWVVFPPQRRRAPDADHPRLHDLQCARLSTPPARSLEAPVCRPLAVRTLRPRTR